ncbi:acetate--CoA ligase family protein [Pseudonocardia acaciae]|uniref:acetate--CoA ligase family protein n=1 Tax=Pseudonocardia acaciae TaxID=551276 RepID=UPI0005656F76|nr:acetate--CoA ligase [Pseudonocardia acaciae]
MVGEWERRAVVSPERLRSFFAPRSVALVGASDGSGWARFIVDSLRTAELPGALVPVHPRHSSVFGLPAVARLTELEEPVDLAFSLVPTHAVEGVLNDAADAGIRNVIVLAAGYGESGDEGRERERRLASLAVERDVTLLGPNCLGYINAQAGSAPFGLRIAPPLRRGPVGIVLQSGALASAVLAFARARAIGISLLTSMGNEAVLTAADVIEYLIEDADTKVIALFLESIRQPERFLELAGRALAAGKPIVALKVGRSEAARASALAHTGAVAGDDAVVGAVLRQFGVVRVDSLEELLVTAGLFGQSGAVPAGSRMGVVTASGGACDIIADRCADAGLTVPEFAGPTLRRLREVLPPFASVRNPLDVTGFLLADQRAAAANIPETALDVVAGDPNVDFVFHSLTLPDAAPPDEEPVRRRLRAVAETRRRASRPIVHFLTTCTDVTPYTAGLLDEYGLHALGGIEFGVKALGHAVRWSRARERGARPVLAEAAVVDGVPDGPWSEARGRELVASCGVPVVPAVLVGDVDAAVAAAGRIGYPVALKVCAASVTHKSDVGGVALGLAGPGEVRAVFSSIRAAAGADADGVLVAAMREGGVEVFAGVTVDPAFGPVLAVGLGGVFVEALADVSLRALPVCAADVREMLAELRGAPLLAGARGRRPADLDRLCEVIARIAGSALALGPALRTLEVNPLWVDGPRVEALDVLVLTGA